MQNHAAAILDRYAATGSEKSRFHQCWYPVAYADEVTAAGVKGIEFLGTKVVAYRGADNQAIVQEAWCPHLGADLSLGACVEGTIRCPYHHWRFGADGVCVDIPTGDKIPPGAKIFTFPTAEAWGLVWAFNGEKPLYGVPKIPDTEEHELFYATYSRDPRAVPCWLATSNGVDFQHVRTLHNLPAIVPEEIEVGDYQIEYCVDTPYVLHHGLIAGTNVFAQHLRVPGSDQFMLFAGRPIDGQKAVGFFVVGVKKPAPGPEAEQVAKAELENVLASVRRLQAEDDLVLNTIKFRRGVLTASDRHLSRYFKYVDAFPLAAGS
jgi:nitrite reductase/ring-hydroxylating ferredoxin subunit